MKPEFERADPVALAAFDPRTKACTMNCGPSFDDPRSPEERRFLCPDCETVKLPRQQDFDWADRQLPAGVTREEMPSSQCRGRAMADQKERLKYPMNHEWHVCINRFHEGKIGKHGQWRSWMYEAKSMADEVPRMAALFAKERNKTLPDVHLQCSMSNPAAVRDNHLTCCLGVKCRECPELLALEAMQRVTPEEIDSAKAWTCAAHIVSTGGDSAKEGYLLTVDARMFWDTVHQNLSETPGDGNG